MAIEIIKLIQNDPDAVCAWLETEGSIDTDTLKMFGIDTDRIVFIEQSDELPAEQCMDILRGLVTSGEFAFICLNSVAALLPTKEVEDDLDKQNIGLLARLLSKFLRTITGAASKNGTTVLFINQLRQAIGSYVPMMNTTGGMAIPFYSYQRIEFRKGKIESSDPIKPEEGMKVKCKVAKNRAATKSPFKECTYFVKYGKGINGDLELGIILPREGIVTKSGAWIYYGSDKDHINNVITKDGEVPGKWNGMAKFMEAITSDEILKQFFIEQLEKNGNEGISLSAEEIEAAKAEEENIENAGKELDKE